MNSNITRLVTILVGLTVCAAPVVADSTSLLGEWTNGNNWIAIRAVPKKLPDDPQATVYATDLVGEYIENNTTPTKNVLGIHKGTMRGEKDKYEGTASTHTFLVFWVEDSQLHVRSDGYNKMTDKIETFSTLVFKKR